MLRNRSEQYQVCLDTYLSASLLKSNFDFSNAKKCFAVNGTIWWLILTITWLLAAGYKWSTEAIEERRLYYHAAAWGIPAVQILVVLVFDKIEGDNITGGIF